MDKKKAASRNFPLPTEVFQDLQLYCVEHHRTLTNAIEYFCVKRMRSGVKDYESFTPSRPGSPKVTFHLKLTKDVWDYIKSISPSRYMNYVIQAIIREEIYK